MEFTVPDNVYAIATYVANAMEKLAEWLPQWETQGVLAALIQRLHS
jgi:hypothetical protein